MNTKSVLLLTVLLIVLNTAFCNFSVPVADTSYQPISLNKPTLLKKFGTDDTSLTLIDYWFSHRSVYKYLSLAGAAGAGICAVALAQENSDSLGGLADKALLALNIATGGLILIVSLTGFLFFPRKKLLKLLLDYRAGKPLPKKLKQKIDNRLKQKVV